MFLSIEKRLMQTHIQVKALVFNGDYNDISYSSIILPLRSQWNTPLVLPQACYFFQIKISIISTRPNIRIDLTLKPSLR